MALYHLLSQVDFGEAAPAVFGEMHRQREAYRFVKVCPAGTTETFLDGHMRMNAACCSLPMLTVSSDIVFQLLSKLIQTDLVLVASDNNTSYVYCCLSGRTHTLKLGKTDHRVRFC